MKCDLCSKNSVVHLKYFDRKLCKEHFSRLTENRIKKNISKNKLVDKNDLVAVAVSGGKDSTTLLFSMAKFAEKFPIRLVGISIDEGIKNYSKKALKFAEKNCKKLGIAHKTFSLQKGISLGKLLEKSAAKIGADKIAAGHNLDDEVQSILASYIKGDFPNLLRAGKNRDVKIIKPLYNIPEKELALYAKLNNFVFYPGKRSSENKDFPAEIKNALDILEQKHLGIKFSILKGFGNLAEKIASV